MSDNSMIRFNPGKGNSYREGDSGKLDGKPSGMASSGKDFKKIMDKEEDADPDTALEEELVKEKSGGAETAEASQKKSTSLFSLAGSQQEAKDGALTEAQTQSPNQLFSTLAANTQPKDTLHFPPHAKTTTHAKAHKTPLHHTHTTPTHTPTTNTNQKVGNNEAEEASHIAEHNLPIDKENIERVGRDQRELLDEDVAFGGSDTKETSISKRKDNTSLSYLEEQPDLSYINPLGAVTPRTETLTTKTAEQPMAMNHIQAIVDQIIKKLYTVTNADGKTDTTIVLKHPPLFEGATIVVSSFETARGQFNISFENLTQQAKYVMDMASNRQALLDNLHSKGYEVHILTTTTVLENTFILPESAEARSNRENQDQQQQQQRQQQEQDDEEGVT